MASRRAWWERTLFLLLVLAAGGSVLFGVLRAPTPVEVVVTPPAATVLVPAMPAPRPTATATPPPTPTPHPTAPPVPTGAAVPSPTLAPTPTPTPSLPSLAAFVAALQREHRPSEAVVGLYLPGVLAARVVEQPPGKDGFVAALPGTVTRFRLAARYYGTLGFLAHNTLAGAAFFHLKAGDVFYVIRGDGGVEAYLVTQLVRYRALQPDSPYSAFIDLATGERLTVAEAFRRTYGSAQGGAVLQTCIARGKKTTWGRLFVLARALGRWDIIPSGGTQ
ncbi:MAG TPA: hypothetical protein ENJ54_01345 [Chloroflexi bacterium]|nr:hypothetical protein [Chloroflexota bacterium]